ncbi:MAG TPA: class I SAM-dependent methyltransferase, partial [Anaerolineales bacterium]|nr:class I SAM-dependent methyltransferase [Anaerolineales bacterium]
FLSQTQITPLSNVSLQPVYAQESLTRGLAQHLPFPDETFDTVVATFPAEYIFDPETLIETRRVLVPGGKFVILPGATITGRNIVDRLLAWIFRVTGETPPDLSQILRERSQEPFAKTGFHVGVHEITVKSSLVFIMLATSIQLREEEQYA